MFNIGDEVEVCIDLPDSYPITRIGSRGVVTSDSSGGWVMVNFHTIEGPWKGKEKGWNHTYEIDASHLKFADGKSLSPIERKIKRMYERQSYFSKCLKNT